RQRRCTDPIRAAKASFQRDDPGFVAGRSRRSRCRSYRERSQTKDVGELLESSVARRRPLRAVSVARPCERNTCPTAGPCICEKVNNVEDPTAWSYIQLRKSCEKRPRMWFPVRTVPRMDDDLKIVREIDRFQHWEH